jgi:hypothetical protein
MIGAGGLIIMWRKNTIQVFFLRMLQYLKNILE